MLLLFYALISVYGSSRKVEAELAHYHVWKFIRRLVKKVHPNDPSMYLPAKRFKRYHYEYGRNRYLTNPVVLTSFKSFTVLLRLSRHESLACLTLMVRARSLTRRSIA